MRILNDLPVSGMRLDAIKISAILAMLIAHVNVIYFDNTFLPVLLLSRGWFSLFCYALACSVLRVQEQKKDLTPYMTSLLILAVITQPFYNIGFEFERANALFTLAAGAAFAFHFEKMSTLLKVIFYSLALIDATLFHSVWEYSIAGALLPATILMILKKQPYALLGFMFMLLCSNMSPIFDYDSISIWITDSVISFVIGMFGLILFFFVPIKLCPDKEKRILPRYAMHIFYPVHLLILGVTAPFINDYF